MKKPIISVLCLLLAIILSSCALTAPPKDGGVPAGQETAASSAPSLPPVRAVVFDTTIDDPVQASLQGGGATDKVDNKASLKLTLYETAPGVFEGEGTYGRTFDNQLPYHKWRGGCYYRTGSISLKSGDSTQTTMPARADWHDETGVFANPELGVFVYDKNYNLRDSFGLTLSIDGDVAKLTFSPDSALAPSTFEGKVTELSPAVENAVFTAPTDKMIYINSTFRPAGNGYERRAILTAEPSPDGTFAGKLCVYAAGNQMPYSDDTVTFKLSAFDEAAYQDAGGKLTGKFGAYGVVQGANAGYIVLMDGDKPLIEAVDGDLTFYGSLIPLDQAEAAKHEAEETKPLMKTLYDGTRPSGDVTDYAKQFKGKDMTDPAVQKALRDAVGGMLAMSKPAWYPGWLMPKPMAADNYAENKSSAAMPFIEYICQYDEAPTVDKVFADYSKQLSGQEGFAARHDSSLMPDYPELTFSTASIMFRKGAYHILITMMQSLGFTGVIVTIV